MLLQMIALSLRHLSEMREKRDSNVYRRKVFSYSENNECACNYIHKPGFHIPAKWSFVCKGLQSLLWREIKDAHWVCELQDGGSVRKWLAVTGVFNQAAGKEHRAQVVSI